MTYWSPNPGLRAPGLPVLQSVQCTDVRYNTLGKRAQGYEFQIVPAGNAEFDGELFQFMGRRCLNSPQECVFKTRMIEVQHGRDAILRHQRLQVGLAEKAAEFRDAGKELYRDK